ncbi:MAG: SIR2 family protein, partial [Silvibacterium sp.]
MQIDELPDYAALKQLAAALWKAGKARGAAVLIGAGFSRNAERLNSNTLEPPLWDDLTRAMMAPLYPEGLETPRDPLRLAEEYRATFGGAALEALIRDRVRDEEWLPGVLHKRLTRLPWTDILTTNWDTLLERAALENLGQTYETVRSIEDIAATRAPRIVKLHGSLPSNRPFILTEEDYRTYPKVFAPFVNLVQQVLLENELCLLGFSGDDPNFLEWSGWVRDQLGVAARRMHLIGALKLSSSERRLLEARNISSIDFTPLLDHTDDPHAAAVEIFLEFLDKSKPPAPWDWPKQSKVPKPITQLKPQLTDAVAHAAELVEFWDEQRRTYPGWVVCPDLVRVRQKTQTISGIHTVRKAFDVLQKESLGRLLFEAVWRHEVFFVPMLPWLRDCCRDAVRSDEYWVDRASRDCVALALLRTAREERDVAAFTEWKAYFEKQPNTESDTAASLCYQECLWARDELDFQTLRKRLQKLSGSDPLWRVRRGALLCELGDFREARRELVNCIREIREHYYRDRGTVWTISRLAWAQFVSRGIRSWVEDPEDADPLESEVLRLRYFETRSDPWEILREVERGIDENLRKIREKERIKEPLFQPGVYREHSRL